MSSHWPSRQISSFDSWCATRVIKTLDVVHRYALLVSNSDICCNPFVHVLSNEAGAGQFMTDFLPLTAWSQLSATRVTVRLVVCLSGTAVTTWLFYSSCLVKGPRKSFGNWLGPISSSNLQGWSFLRLLSFGKVWKENNDPLVCSSAHPTAAHSRGIFVVEWLMVKTRLIRHSPQWSVCDVRNLRHGSRAYFEIKTSRRNSAWSACISSFVNIFTFMVVTFY